MPSLPYFGDHPKCKRRRTEPSRTSSGAHAWSLLGLLLTAHAAAAQVNPQNRWGAATTIAGTTLYMQGGKCDPSNMYSYSSAPNTNDLFALNLTQPFDSSDPPWQYISGSQAPNTSQGPAVAFHTFSAYTLKRALAFGGYGGPTLPIETNPDSAWLLNFVNQDDVTWTQEPTTWASEPVRRMYHAASVVGKNVWITGGQKADGSGLGFAETWIFNGSGSGGEFSQFGESGTGSSSISSGARRAVISAGASLPMDLVGHRTVYLSNGILLLLGGYSPSRGTLNSFSTLYYIDTTSKIQTWQTMAAMGAVPAPRRNFAVALLDGNQIVIHGGGDGPLQTLFSDGAILDMQANPITWSTLPANSAIQARTDHLGVGAGMNAIFGYGYGPSGPASADVFVYDASAGTWTTTYTPNGSVIGNNATVTTGVASGATTAQSWPASTFTGFIPGQSPTSTLVTPTSSSSSAADPTTSANDSTSKSKKNIAAIAFGVILACAALIALLIVGLYWHLRRRQYPHRGARRAPWIAGDRHRLIQSSGDTEDPPLPGSHARADIPVAHSRSSQESPFQSLLSLLPIPFRRRSGEATGIMGRIDMLHDEDAREFGHAEQPSAATTATGAHSRPTFRRFGSSTRHLWSGVMNASTASFKAAGAALGFGGEPFTSGTATPGTEEKGSPDWWEKTNDPFAEDAVALANLPSVTAAGMGFANRQRGGQGHQLEPTYGSYDSYKSIATTYRDPFTDSFGHSRTPSNDSRGLYTDVPRSDSYQPFMLPLDDPPPPSVFVSANPSPPPLDISTVTSANKAPIPGLITPGTLATSSDSVPQLFTPVSETAGSSNSHPSLIGAAPTAPIKRSDSWWTRFAQSSLNSLSRSTSLNPIRRLSLRNGSGSRSPVNGYASLDFRDPNPPPKLEDIEETGKSNDPSPNSPNKKRSGSASDPASRARGLHSKSLVSVQTADSKKLEEMGGRFDVIQRGRTGTGGSEISVTPAGSINEDWEMGAGRLVPLQHATPSSSVRQPTSGSLSSPSPDTPSVPDGKPTSPLVQSPRAMTSPVTSPGVASTSSQSTPGTGTQETFATAQTHQSFRAAVQAQRPSAESFKTAKSSMSPPLPPPVPHIPNLPGPSRSGVASRIAVFENMALVSSPVSSPTSPVPKSPTSPRAVDKRKSLGGVHYGLTARPSLFVANPDKRSESGSTADLTDVPPS